MQLLDTFGAFAALICFSLFFATRRGVNASVAPLLSIGGVMVALSLAGVAGILVPGTWAVYALALLCLAWVLVFDRKKLAGAILAPGFVLFLGMGLVALIYLGVRQPLFSEWDEFVSWGMAPKFMKYSGVLYSTATARAAWPWTATERPGLVMLGYFTQFLGQGFAPWKVFCGYDLLLFAVAAAPLGLLRRNDWRTAVPLAAAGLLLPFFFSVVARTVYMSRVYLSSYADIPAGMLFGGALAVYFVQRAGLPEEPPAKKTKRPPLPAPAKNIGRGGGLLAAGRTWWPALLPLSAFALTKENTFPIVLVAAGIMAADTLFFADSGASIKKWLGKIGAALSFFAAPLLVSRAWGMQTAWANAQNPVTQGAQTGVDPIAAAVAGLRELLGLAPRSERFLGTLNTMVRAFLDGVNYPVSMLGSGAVTAVVILGMFLLAALLAKGVRARLRVSLVALLSTLGFLGYQFILLISYAFVFDYGGAITDYGRYLSSYFVGWFMVALCMVALCAREVSPKKTLVARAGLTLAGGVLTALFLFYVLPGYSVLDYPGDAYAAERAEQQTAEQLAAKIEPGSRVFFVSQNDNGGEWFRYSYYLLPIVLDYSAGNGTFGPPGMDPEPDNYVPMTLAEMREYLKKSGCSYILLEESDDAFVETYADLFSDGLKTWNGAPVLYKLGENGRYEPVA